MAWFQPSAFVQTTRGVRGVRKADTRNSVQWSRRRPTLSPTM